MSRCFAALFAVTWLTLCSGTATARTWHVFVDGTGDAPTIQAGINAASVGDTVLVAPGRYFESINYWGKDLVLKSEAGPEVTIIDGSDSLMTTVLMTHAETRAAVLEGFTITGGSGSFWGGTLTGGGLLCKNSSPIVRDNHFVGNRLDRVTYGRGGGVAIGTGGLEDPTPAPVFEDNLFQDNVTSGNAGGLMIAHADAVIRRNVFIGNEAGHGDGGGIWCYLMTGQAVIEGNQFWENEASDHGAGLYVSAVSVTPVRVEGNLFVRNTAYGMGNGNTGSGGGLWAHYTNGSIVRNTFVKNIGLGESQWNGGGILLVQSEAGLTVRSNILALNVGGGVGCELEQRADFGPNLFWDNEGGNFPQIRYECPSAWADSAVVADPLFCDADGDNFTVAKDSPALTGPEIMGVWAEPGCGPGVPVQRTTWGQIKARYE
jgi:hypothetical protein